MLDSAVSNVDTSMTINELKNFLPHRYPFLLVDRVLEVEGEKRLKALKNVTVNEQFFNGHFPERPVMPGVLILEALAQAGAIMAYYSANAKPEDFIFYLAAIEKVRFKRVVEPGDQLILNVEMIVRRGQLWKFKGYAEVDGELACSAEMSSMEGPV